MSKTSDLIGLGTPSQLAPTIASSTIGAPNVSSVSTGLTATGTTITDALALVSIVNLVTTTAASTGVKLPDVDIGAEVIVQNNGANALNLFPPTSAGILNGAAAGAALTIAAAAGNRAIRVSSTTWLVTVTALEA